MFDGNEKMVEEIGASPPTPMDFGALGSSTPNPQEILGGDLALNPKVPDARNCNKPKP